MDRATNGSPEEWEKGKCMAKERGERGRGKKRKKKGKRDIPYYQKVSNPH